MSLYVVLAQAAKLSRIINDLYDIKHQLARSTVTEFEKSELNHHLLDVQELARMTVDMLNRKDRVIIEPCKEEELFYHATIRNRDVHSYFVPQSSVSNTTEPKPITPTDCVSNSLEATQEDLQFYETIIRNSQTQLSNPS